MAADVNGEEIYTGNRHNPRVLYSESESGELVGLQGLVRWHRLRVHCYSLRLVRGGCVLPLIQRGKAEYSRSRGIPTLACVDDV